MSASQPKLRASLRAAFKNRPFVFGAGIYLLTWIAIDILQTTLLFFLKYVLDREAQSDLIMATIFVTAILALPLWTWAAKRWDKRWAYIVGTAFWAAVQLVMVTLNPGSALGWLLGLSVLAGIGIGAAYVLPWSMIPDAIEWDEWRTGERHEGMFYSLISLMQKVASSIAIPLILVLLDTTGYLPNAGQQPASALTGIRLVVGPIPAILLWAGILFAWLYPLNRSEYDKIVTGLEERRSAAREALPGEGIELQEAP